MDLQHLTPEQRVDLAELTLSIVDGKCTDASGTRCMVEMQSLSVEGFDIGRRALSRRDEDRLTTGFSERDGDAHGRAKEDRGVR